MMWSTIANLKENLNKIALDVHDDDDEELEIYSPMINGDHPSVSDRRISHSFAHSNSFSRSPVANGVDSAYNLELEQYKAQIKRLQESEAEIKALSVNYAALLKEKEDKISRLNEENGSLKQNLDATNAVLNASGNGSFKSSRSSPSVLKGSGDQSPNRQNKLVNQVKSRLLGNQINNGVVAKQDGLSNGIARVVADISQSTMESKQLNMLGKEKELADLLEEKGGSLEAVHHESQMKKLRAELEKERDKLAKVQLNLQEEQKLNESFQKELISIKKDKEETLSEMNNLRSELNEKITEIRRLQEEFNQRQYKHTDDTVESLKRAIAILEKENSDLKMDKNQLEDALRMRTSSTGKSSPDSSGSMNKHPTKTTDPAGSFPGKEEMELSLQKLEKDLQETRQERDKASQQLIRLKQHLLEKESEESEKMDEDSKVIEELQQNNEIQRAQILHLEKALKQAIANQEEIRIGKQNELQNSKEVIDDLNRKVASLMSRIDAKNVELLNLQTALGQYYAEIEAKEHVEEDLAMAREETAKLSQLLKEADQKAEILRRENEDTLSKLSHTEKMLAEGKNRVIKVEEDNSKLRRALEQSMTRLNRMSMDSDYFVDRRIVIKLLVTYFQRNHSKEVLDLMVRMLGFSDEDKQRIGIAQYGAGKGVVRGVFGLPGRLVGGFLGGSSPEVHANSTSDNQSFADLWVDFLIKETEEREKESIQKTTGGSKDDLQGRTSDATKPNTVSPTGFAAAHIPTSHNPTPQPSRFNISPYGHPDSEFSTVPLTSSESNPQISRLHPRY